MSSILIPHTGVCRQATCCGRACSLSNSNPGTHRTGDWERPTVKLNQGSTVYFTLITCKEHWKAAGRIILKCMFGKWVRILWFG